jgi:hypothetical protein
MLKSPPAHHARPARALPVSEQGERLPMRALRGLDQGAGAFETGVATAWTEQDGALQLTVTTATAVRGAQGQPLCLWLPRRLPGARVTAGSEFEPVATEDFLLVTKPDYGADRTWSVTLRGPAP